MCANTVCMNLYIMHSHTFFQPWLKAHHTIFHKIQQTLCLQNMHKNSWINNIFSFTGTTVAGLERGAAIHFSTTSATTPGAGQTFKRQSSCRICQGWHTVDGSKIQRSPVEDGKYPSIYRVQTHHPNGGSLGFLNHQQYRRTNFGWWPLKRG